MEVLLIRLLHALAFIATTANAAFFEPTELLEVSELKNFFFDKIHEIENRYEEKLETLRDEMLHNNVMLRNSVDELKAKLESERREKSATIKQIEKNFLKKETQLTTEIKDLKNQLTTERNYRNREVGLLKAMIVESMTERETDLNMTKEKGKCCFKRFW